MDCHVSIIVMPIHSHSRSWSVALSCHCLEIACLLLASGYCGCVWQTVHQSVAALLTSTHTKFDWLARESQGMVFALLCFEVTLIYRGVSWLEYMAGEATPNPHGRGLSGLLTSFSACFFLCFYVLFSSSVLQRRNAHCVEAECMLTSCRRAPCCYAHASKCRLQFRCLHM